jgi:Winged helix DNA-binding domain
VRPDQWIEGWREVADADEALREVCRRFLRTYGPARPADFREWFASSAFTVADARALFESIAPDLEEIDVEGRGAFVVAGDRSFPVPSSRLRLVPEYDAYVMGFRERDQLVPQPVRELVAEHGRGRYEGPAGVRFVLVDGIAAGLWEREKRGKRIELQVRLVRRPGKSRRPEFEREAECIGAFFGLEPMLTVEPSS